MKVLSYFTDTNEDKTFRKFRNLFYLLEKDILEDFW